MGTRQLKETKASIAETVLPQLNSDKARSKIDATVAASAQLCVLYLFLMWYQTVPSFLHTYINVLVHFSLHKKLNGWTFKGPESCYPFIQYGCSISSNGRICRARRPPLHSPQHEEKIKMADQILDNFLSASERYHLAGENLLQNIARLAVFV